MAIGALDVNGVYIYGEDDPASPVSDLLNLGMDSVSDAVGDAKARLTVLETEASVWTPVTFTAGYEDYSASFPCQVRKIGKVAYLRGMVKRTAGWALATSYTPVLTIPVGFRNVGQQLLFTVYAASGSTTMSPAGFILTNGNGDIRTGPTGTPAYVSLDGVSWLVD